MDGKTVILTLSSWWGGLSMKPGNQRLTLFDDGSYIVEVSYSFPQAAVDNFKHEGKIEPNRVERIKHFLAENIQQNISKVMSDGGNTIKYVNGAITYTIENDQPLWWQITALVPEYKRSN